MLREDAAGRGRGPENCSPRPTRSSSAERIGFAREAPFSRIVLSTAPLQWEEYASVTPVPGALYCVDGFHRLVAWAAAGRLGKDANLEIWLAG
jgi:hypothetical protein